MSALRRTFASHQSSFRSLDFSRLAELTGRGTCLLSGDRCNRRHDALERLPVRPKLVAYGRSGSPILEPCLRVLLPAAKELSVGAITIQLGSVGIWTTQFENFPATQMQEATAELEELGFGAIWFGEAVGREALTQAGLLLAATKKIVVATGIANIYGRDPFAMAAGQKTLAEAYADRFVLGLGVSHVPLVEKLRGVHRYEKPVRRQNVIGCKCRLSRPV